VPTVLALHVGAEAGAELELGCAAREPAKAWLGCAASACRTGCRTGCKLPLVLLLADAPF
jgi:hypothetical protein